MVKSTVRFPAPVVEEIESLVEEGHFESKSEFYRFATDYMLELIVEDYTPETIDFEDIKSEVLVETNGRSTPEDEVPFFDSVAMVRQYALRGNISDAEDFIDHQYTAGDRHALMLEELLNAYRQRYQVADTPRPVSDTETPSVDRSR